MLYKLNSLTPIGGFDKPSLCNCDTISAASGLDAPPPVGTAVGIKEVRAHYPFSYHLPPHSFPPILATQSLEARLTAEALQQAAVDPLL